MRHTSPAATAGDGRNKSKKTAATCVARAQGLGFAREREGKWGRPSGPDQANWVEPNPLGFNLTGGPEGNLGISKIPFK
jgi:hypothetical protein